MNRCALMILVVVACVVSDAIAGPQSLRERAKAGGGVGKNELFIEFDEPTIPQLVARSDVIVYGRVSDARSRLASDGSFVMTDYVIAPIRVLKQTVAASGPPKPGPTVPLVATHPGGTVVDNGDRLTTVVDAYPVDDMFHPGDEVVVFLTYGPDKPRFSFSNGPFAVFKVKDGVAQAMTKEAAQRRGETPIPVGDFLKDLEQHLKR